MNDPVSAEMFWNAFSTQLLRQAKSCSDFQMTYDSNPAWTGTVMAALRDAGLELGYKPGKIWTEYYRLDMTWFSYPESTYPHTLWNLEVAIEHENDSGKWYDEWVKLSHITCGLKVLISYHYHGRGRTPEQAMEEPLKMYRCLRYKPPRDSWLVIFGPTSQEPERPWVGLTFDGHKLTRRFEMKLIS
jgi:hypothetical protein